MKKCGNAECELKKDCKRYTDKRPDFMLKPFMKQGELFCEHLIVK
jgi:hypothetical protein